MSAAYDTFNYPSYWKDRDYEHLAEVYALKSLLEKIPFCACALEVGAGFGRLVPEYELKAKQIIISDPSTKLLAIARQKNRSGNTKFIQSTLENLTKKVKPKSVDLIILVRVLHHIEDVQKAFEIVNRLLSPGGYFILEFPNKAHFKASLKEILKGNITYPIDISPKTIGSKAVKGEGCLPFYNYHPDKIKHSLGNADFSVITRRSVSNIRSRIIKKIIPTGVLMLFERPLQSLLATIDFGPSIFILARKGKASRSN